MEVIRLFFVLISLSLIYASSTPVVINTWAFTEATAAGTLSNVTLLIY